jgi:2-phospho-L-lactate guanylyltransferase (CobY/MobA/RfbA family)
MAAYDRRSLAEMTALRALNAAVAVTATLAVCGSTEAAGLASERGAAVLVERSPQGQNPAANLGLAEARRRGAHSALLLSSDLPLVDATALQRLLAHTDRTGAVVVAAPALGRKGTNALFLRPLTNFTMHFGEASLPKFEAEAHRRSRQFIIHDDPCLALDLDEASDIATWRRLEASA